LKLNCGSDEGPLPESLQAEARAVKLAAHRVRRIVEGRMVFSRSWAKVDFSGLEKATDVPLGAIL
jgi:hypothetical protein